MARESLFSLYKRWRHTRGFGVHSPFAYRIVREVIHPPRGYAYYAELRPGMNRIERIAYRLNVFLHNEHLPKVLRISASKSPANEDKRIKRIEDWRKTLSSPLFIENPTETERDTVTATLRAANHGLILSARSYLIAVPRLEMSFVSYSLL